MERGVVLPFAMMLADGRRASAADLYSPPAIRRRFTPGFGVQLDRLLRRRERRLGLGQCPWLHDQHRVRTALPRAARSAFRRATTGMTSQNWVLGVEADYRLVGHEAHGADDPNGEALTQSINGIGTSAAASATPSWTNAALRHRAVLPGVRARARTRITASPRNPPTSDGRRRRRRACLRAELDRRKLELSSTQPRHEGLCERCRTSRARRTCTSATSLHRVGLNYKF